MATILIADDNASEIALMTRVVKDMGHQSLAVTNGQECLEMAEKMKPDLILLDNVMPRLDGFNTCRKLKATESTANIPVIIVTSKNAESDQFWGQRQGASAYLVKPFDPQGLRDAIERFLS